MATSVVDALRITKKRSDHVYTFTSVHMTLTCLGNFMIWSWFLLVLCSPWLCLILQWFCVIFRCAHQCPRCSNSEKMDLLMLTLSSAFFDFVNTSWSLYFVSGCQFLKWWIWHFLLKHAPGQCTDHWPLTAIAFHVFVKWKNHCVWHFRFCI